VGAQIAMEGALIEVELILAQGRLCCFGRQDDRFQLQVTANELDRDSFAAWFRTRVVRKAP
jgi:hypothetical protein